MEGVTIVNPGDYLGLCEELSRLLGKEGSDPVDDVKCESNPQYQDHDRLGRTADFPRPHTQALVGTEATRELLVEIESSCRGQSIPRKRRKALTCLC